MLTAYILANSVTAGMKNQLLLLTPKGYPAWGKSKCLAKMASDPGIWSRITVIDKRYIKQEIKKKGLKNLLDEYRTKLLLEGTIDQVYLANDKMLGNQLAVELVRNTKYIRFDEGSASYFLKKRKWTSKISELVLLKILRCIVGLKSDMVYNFDSIGSAKAGTADYLYKPQLLERFSPDPIAIQKSAITLALQRLTPMMDEYKALEQGEVALYLGNKQVDQKVISAETEIKLLSEIQKMLSKRNMKLLYKPHPAEHADKLEKYSREVPGMQFFETYEPIEIILQKYSTIKYLISFGSSAMLYAEVFSQNQGLVLLSTLHLIGLDETALDKYSILKMNMQKSGVKIPATINEMQKYLTD
ncbi:MAG: hypothetical protein H6Q65_85 [Firmicutes bacterium]|nr:hypothetical protein [Bacillota bacterium]